jgi:oxygen-independent coproporphyrinogen-3 oxidase
MDRPRALYVHVPFCARVCPYCSFNVTSRFDAGSTDRFLDAVERELAGLGPPGPIPLQTLYLGGGTPTVLDPTRLERLLAILGRRADPETLIEWTVETNPDSMTAEKASALEEAGVTRVSIGAQSLQPRFLAKLGRTHAPDDVRRCLDLLRKAGIGQINVDLMYGLPGQSLEDWMRDVESALDLDPDHLSLYELTFDAGTPFTKQKVRGRIVQAEDSLAVGMFHAARERLSRSGIEWYEISNFAKPGCESEHNRTYWRNDPYFGVGPGAFGCVDGERTTNANDVSEWCRMVETTGAGVAVREPLSARDTFVETLAAGLRTREGVDLRALRERTGIDVLESHRSVLEGLGKRGLAEWTAERLRLLLPGVLLLDSVLLDFVEPSRT